jgi:type II secretory ATPase GspE/PulE/Tfp pilus assembly ATPase PilB-like protein
MIIVTGPTGSGKTTTLYAFLKKIKKPEIKIITIEDPIEYHLGGISQTQVNPSKGYDFANGLRSIMRQDPDTVLVGEIRDLETASIALQAALTGHLVFTTLHTNDAAGTVARLQALGEKPINIAPAINMAVAQRLVRKVCQKCSKLEKVPPEVLAKIKKTLKNIPPAIKIPKLNSDLKIPRAVGCKNCNFTGFKGRVGIFEAFLVDSEMEKFILKSPSITALKENAQKKGMITMYQDGILKVLKGVTTMEEIERVATE